MNGFNLYMNFLISYFSHGSFINRAHKWISVRSLPQPPAIKVSSGKYRRGKPSNYLGFREEPPEVLIL